MVKGEGKKAITDSGTKVVGSGHNDETRKLESMGIVEAELYAENLDVKNDRDGKILVVDSNLTMITKEASMIFNEEFSDQKTNANHMKEVGQGSVINELVIIDHKRRRVQEGNPMSEDQTEDMVVETTESKNGGKASFASQAHLDK